MSNNIKTARNRLTIPQRIEILDQSLNGNYSQPELGQWTMRKFGLNKPVAQQTISNILNSAETLYKSYNVAKTGKSVKGTRYPQPDDEIRKYVADMNANNLPVNRDSIIRYIKVITSTKYQIPQGSMSFSTGWLTKAFTRIGLKCRPTHGECASVDITSENIQNELRKIEKLLEPYDPADIMNFDETGLYYQQPPRRTVCFGPIGGLKKSKTRLTIGLLCNVDGTYKGHPIVIGKYKSPQCFKTHSRLLSKTAVGNRYEVEYHHSTNAWMTTEIFTAYVKKLDVAFGRDNRKIALLLDNASVHNLRIELQNIKLIFLPANTTSKLQALDAGIIANFKLHFRSRQYERALNIYIAKRLNNANVYHMNQVEAMFFVAEAWLKVKPETIKNCWKHANLLAFKDCPVESVTYPESPLPLVEEDAEGINSMIADLPGNFDGEVTNVHDLDLETDENEMMLCYQQLDLDTDEPSMELEEVEEVEEEEENEEAIAGRKRRLRESYESILMYDFPVTDFERQVHRYIRAKLADSRSEVMALKEQADLRSYITK
ncbi:hypothetical protein INT48_001310 [Thamnidium elegans]|uniref:DDE-1 domain-containing protein n=1 Tax=Thamnidium elegans TaxID=101142 RepID=A0A8H7SQQ5_9FUNG|nr:hypothetical protein INT48_001310 [Thamnidium elegans]